MFSSPQRWFAAAALAGMALVLTSVGQLRADPKGKAKGCTDGGMCKVKDKGACDKCAGKDADTADGMCADGMCMAKGKGKCTKKGAGMCKGMGKGMGMSGMKMGMCKGMGNGMGCGKGMMGGNGMGMCMDGGMGMMGGKGMGMMGMNHGMGMGGMRMGGVGMCCGMGMASRMTMMQNLQKQQYEMAVLQKEVTRLSKRSKSSLREALNDTATQTRAAAAWLIGERRLPLQDELIGLLTDQSEIVRQSSRRSLILLSMPAKEKTSSRSTRSAPQPRGADFGPLAGADAEAQSAAAQQWRQWWHRSR